MSSVFSYFADHLRALPHHEFWSTRCSQPIVQFLGTALPGLNILVRAVAEKKLYQNTISNPNMQAMLGPEATMLAQRGMADLSSLLGTFLQARVLLAALTMGYRKCALLLTVSLVAYAFFETSDKSCFR